MVKNVQDTIKNHPSSQKTRKSLNNYQNTITEASTEMNQMLKLSDGDFKSGHQKYGSLATICPLEANKKKQKISSNKQQLLKRTKWKSQDNTTTKSCWLNAKIEMAKDVISETDHKNSPN